MSKLNILPDMTLNRLVLAFFIINELISRLHHHIDGLVIAILLHLQHDVTEVTLSLLLRHQQIFVHLDVELAF